MAKRFSPKFKAAALALLDSGVTTREAQAQLRKRFRGEHVGEGTLRKWAKDRDAAALAPVEDDAPESAPHAPEPPAAAAPDALPSNVDTYEHTRVELARAKQRADEAARDGNHTAAQRFSKQVVDYTLLLARLDKDRKADTDVVVIPRGDLERVRQAMRDRVAALAADLERTGGLVCSHCGRDIRIALARGEKGS